MLYYAGAIRGIVYGKHNRKLASKRGIAYKKYGRELTSLD
jgi:hypothetical protein